MNAIRFRFLLANAMFAVLGLLVGVIEDSRVSTKLAKLTKPIEICTKAVVEGAETGGSFSGFLPGNFK